MCTGGGARMAYREVGVWEILDVLRRIGRGATALHRPSVDVDEEHCIGEAMKGVVR